MCRVRLGTAGTCGVFHSSSVVHYAEVTRSSPRRYVQLVEVYRGVAVGISIMVGRRYLRCQMIDYFYHCIFDIHLY